MRRESKILVATLAFAGLWTGGSRVPEALASMETFKVTDVQIRGLRYLDRDVAMDLLGVDGRTSVWADRHLMAEALREHTLVKDVQIDRRLPGTLLVNVVERRPVALVPTPTLEAVDNEGVRLPVDPAQVRLDLPVIVVDEQAAQGASLVPDRTRRLMSVVARLQEADPTFLQQVSEVAWHDATSVVARWSEPRVDFLIQVDASTRRLREGFAVLADAVVRDSHSEPVLVDLRYADQVVVRRESKAPAATPLSDGTDHAR